MDPQARSGKAQLAEANRRLRAALRATDPSGIHKGAVATAKFPNSWCELRPFRRGSWVVVSLGLVEILDQSELQGMVEHELHHANNWVRQALRILRAKCSVSAQGRQHNEAKVSKRIERECDDACSDPTALARALQKMDDRREQLKGRPSSNSKRWSRYPTNSERVVRLLGPPGAGEFVR